MISNLKCSHYYRTEGNRPEEEKPFQKFLVGIQRDFLDDEGYPMQLAVEAVSIWNTEFNKRGLKYRIEGYTYQQCGSLL